MRENSLAYERLRELRKKLEPDSPSKREALMRIGERLKASAKLEMRRQGMIDSGNLWNSIEYQYTRNGIEFGSFGVVYAAMNEFGGRITIRQLRAMFAAMRDRGGPQRKDKNVINGLYWRSRPYITYAVEKERPYMLEIFRRFLG